MKYFCTINGIRYDYFRMEFGREISVKSANKCELLLNIVGSRVPTTNEEIVITKEVNDTIITRWKGTVEKVQHIPLENSVVKVIGFDKKRKLQYLHVASEGYSLTKGSAITTAEIAPVGTTGLTAGTISTTDSAINTVNLGKTLSSSSTKSKLNRADALEIVQMMSDRDIHIDVDGVVNFSTSSGAGTDHSEGTAEPIVLIHGINGRLSPDVGYSKDEIKRVKQVIVKGYGVGTEGAIGAAGTPASTDKVKQIELPFIQNNTDAANVAQSFLSELDQQLHYATFDLEYDIHPFDYDVYDTVTLKATLPAITINENLKIFAIKYVVSDDRNEQVTLTLANFRRGVWAKYVIPEAVADNFSESLDLNLTSTQAQQQLISTNIQQVITAFNAPIEVDTSFTSINQLTFNSNKTLGAYLIISLDLVPLHLEDNDGDDFLLRVTDGVNYYPNSTGMNFIYSPTVGKKQRFTITIFIPANTESKTYDIEMKMNSASGLVETGCFVNAYSIGL